MRANLALRFLLELAGIAAIAYWGFNAVDAWPLQVALAIIGPVVFITAWGRIVAPRAVNAISQTTRVLIGSVILLVTAGALALAGLAVLALAFAVLVIVNTFLMQRLGGPSEWR